MAQGANVTLIRGRNLSVIHPTNRRLGATVFKRGEARFVEDEAIIKHCEEQYEVVVDSDEEEVEKPVFVVERTNRRSAPDAPTVKTRSAAAANRRTRATRKA